MPTRGQVTERSFYPNLIKLIGGKGGSGVSEVSYNSEPDIVFDLENRRWLLAVKIGESTTTLKSAFVQYQRHKEESGLVHGLLVFLPESVRGVSVEESALDHALATKVVSCLVDTPNLKEEYGDVPFPTVLDRLKADIVARLARHEEKAYSPALIVKFLQEQVTELMERIPPEDPSLLKAITNKDLLSGIGSLDKRQSKVATQFLGASILLSQTLFLRLYGAAHPEVLPAKPVSKRTLREAFKRIRSKNYRPIYDFDVVDTVSEEYLRETFDLISGLEVEKTRYEIPGRLFQAIMPRTMRKLMAAFYTRPQSADILTHLVIEDGDCSVFDPACGSGTILASAYRRKLELSVGSTDEELHKRFCQEQIFGSDIMPFAVHLATANLAAMNPSVTIERTQIIRGDSLKLSPGEMQAESRQSLFPTIAKSKTMEGLDYEVDLKKVDVVLMNPPFTKVERGIRQFVGMDRFRNQVGGEIGLWGHFVVLAETFLKREGTLGAVLPVSVFRGRETEKIRKLFLTKMKPLYVVKATLNYGFSESSEYRDVLLIASKAQPQPEDEVRFALLKIDVNEVDWTTAQELASIIKSKERYRSEKIDVESFTIADLRKMETNLMPFLGVTDYEHRDILTSFISRFDKHFDFFPDKYVSEGLRTEGNLASLVLFTRKTQESRVEEAFLGFDQEDGTHIVARSPLGVEYRIEKQALVPSLRTGVGLKKLSIDGIWDYAAQRPYAQLERVAKAAGLRAPQGEAWLSYFTRLKRNLESVRTETVLTLRVNPFSPNVHLLAFHSDTPISPTDQFKAVNETDPIRAKALCVLMNSLLFLANLFLFKEETTGRYIHIRSHDLKQLRLIPQDDVLNGLARVYDTFAQREFPCLREQLDRRFTQNYEEFRARRRWPEGGLTIEPSPVRIEFDKAVIEALGESTSDEELICVYRAIVKEMIVTRGLTRD